MAPKCSNQNEINESTGDDVNSCDTAAISYSALSSNVMPFRYMDNLKTESVDPIMWSMSSSTYREDLSAILVRQIDAEKDAGNNVMPEELDDLKSDIETEWTISDGKGDRNMAVKMFRKEHGIGGLKASVEFNCQDREEEVLIDDSDDNTPDELAAGMKFDATITRSGKSPTFSFTALGTDAEVEEVVIRNADGSTTSDDEMFYAGPTLEELEEYLQQSWNDFVVNECGLNEDFVALKISCILEL